MGVVDLWDKLVWHKVLIPHFFTLWLAFHRGLRTMDRLISFGMFVKSTCILCSSQSKTFKHLFFQCDYSFRVLLSIPNTVGGGVLVGVGAL